LINGNDRKKGEEEGKRNKIILEETKIKAYIMNYKIT